jgi:hypothetical protein
MDQLELSALPPWSSIAVVDLGEGPSGVPLAPPVPAESFNGRFQEILEMGVRDWVNVGVLEVRDGVLIVEVEYRTTSASDPSTSVSPETKSQSTSMAQRGTPWCGWASIPMRTLGTGGRDQVPFT